MAEQKIAGMECLRLKGWAVTGDDEPVADFISQELDGTEGRKFAAKFWIFGVGAFGKNEPNAVVPRIFGMIPEHKDYVVAQVDGKTRKHAADLGIQGHEGFHNESVRRFLFWFGGTRHGTYRLSERTITDQGNLWTYNHQRQSWKKSRSAEVNIHGPFIGRWGQSSLDYVGEERRQMFERYTEKARRVIFFARYEASQFGSPYIETEHLLLGLVREDKALTSRFLRSHAVVESIRKQIETHTVIREKVATSVDLPLSDECKRILAYAAEEAERLSNKQIGPEHLLLGLLREEKGLAATLLKERGLQLDKVREELTEAPHKPLERGAPAPMPLGEFSRDLTQAALDGELEPVVGREQELAAVIEILCRREHRNPILIGERGVGKKAMVEGLAQRIADGEAPPFLAEKRIVVLDMERSGGGTKDRPKPEEVGGQIAKLLADRSRLEDRLGTIVKALLDAPHVILFIDELAALLSTSRLKSLSAVELFRPALVRGKIQCIGAITPEEYKTLTQAVPWIDECFRAIHVRAMDAETTLGVLQARKGQCEKFYELTYSDEALERAARESGRYLPESALPGKALELLDAAGSRVKLRQAAPPEDVAELQKSIRFIVHRMEGSIANHEFEKARFYSHEEKKERESLRLLRERYKLDDSSSIVVSGQDVEETIAGWTKYPFKP
jgi:ATP-dependent Clp protease ATP-binding subunit ClpC